MARRRSSLRAFRLGAEPKGRYRFPGSRSCRSRSFGCARSVGGTGAGASPDGRRRDGSPARKPAQAATGELCIVAAGSAAPLAAAALKGAGISMPTGPESLALLETRASGRRALLACGADARGLVYALLELADRVRLQREPDAALKIDKPIVERPANKVRSVMRQFTSETARQAVVLRPRNVAALPEHAGGAALQPVPPGLRARLRHPAPGGGLLLPVPLSVSAFRAGLRRAGDESSRRRARPQPGDAAVHQRADRRARHGVPVGNLDARIPVGPPARAPKTPSRDSPPKPTLPTAAMP